MKAFEISNNPVSNALDYIYRRRKEGLGDFRSFLAEQTEHQNVAHERLLKIALQVSVLFLTGWVALLSVGKLENPPFGTLKIWLFVCCGLHILTLTLVCIAEWKIMVAHFERAISLEEMRRDFETTIGKMHIETEPHLALPTAAPDNLLDKVIEIEKVEHTALIRKDTESVENYNKKNATSWLFGRASVICFVISLLTSTIALVLLVAPPKP